MPARSRSVLVLALALVGSLAAQKDQRLVYAEKQLGEHAEQDVRDGTDTCVSINNVAAVELLLAVLNETERKTRLALHPAHYRDIVWEGLVRITDRYARERVQIELRGNGKNAFVRQWSAQLLGSYGDQSFGAALRKSLADRDDGVKRQAARSLGQLKFAEAQPQLLRLIRDGDPYLRANAIEALATIDPAAHEATFVAALRDDDDGGVRCALLGAAATLLPDRAEKFSSDALEDRDWRPRMQAVDNLARIRTKTAIDSLVRAAKDGRPAVAARAEQILREVTGQPIRSADVWTQWWRDHRDTFEFAGEKTKAEDKAPRRGDTVAYNDIPMESDHAAFLIDRSVAMKQNLSSSGVPKEDAARQELDRVLGMLRGRLTFNVFGYHEEVKAFGKKPVELTEASRQRAVKFIATVKLGQAKDIWQALETVVADATLDTAYLLSSGEPDIGTYVHWNRVTEHLRDLNRFHKVTVHTIAYSDQQWYRDQLAKIAEATGGEFRAFQ
jgi:HEAT repeat protein